MKKRIIAILLCVALCAMPIFAGAEPTSDGTKELTVLFTHDLHSHLLPATDEEDNSYGGYARLMTAIYAQKAMDPEALLVDGGDFSMGSLFQTVYATHASELRIMGFMGYDVTTFGNHEYDYRATGLADMLNAAVASGDALPQIVEANYLPPAEGEEGYGEDAAAVWAAFENYGVKDYTVIEKNGVNFAVFGMAGIDADECAPMSGMILHDTVETAKEIVARIEAEVPAPRVVVCLSHGGTTSNEKKSEDLQLAKSVEGIDLIISGHTHTILHEAIEENGTYIVSAGEYGKNLGVVKLALSPDGEVTLSDYQLVAINDGIVDDPDVSAKVDEYKHMVEEGFLADFGIESFDQVIVNNPYTFDSLSQLNEHKEATLGTLISDAYRWAVEQAEGEGGAPVDFAMTANGVIRETLPIGDVTMSDVYNISSLGIGPDGVAGYPLVSVYITGQDLINALEVDASVTAIMPAAQLYFTGVTSTFNPHRMIFNKVTDSGLILASGEVEPIDKDRLYRVVTGLYCGQMLGAVNEKSFGILSITPRDADGNVVEDIETCIIHDENGREIKEWYALTAYLQQMGTVDEKYSDVQGYKNIVLSKKPADLLRGANKITILAIAIVVVLIAVIVLVICLSVRRRKLRKAGKLKKRSGRK